MDASNELLCRCRIRGRAYDIVLRARYTLAHVNCKLRKIVSEDDLDIQQAARKGIDVKLACPGSLCPPGEGNRERAEKKGSTVTTSFARQNSRGPRGPMKAVRKKEGNGYGIETHVHGKS